MLTTYGNSTWPDMEFMYADFTGPAPVTPAVNSIVLKYSVHLSATIIS